MGDNNLWRKGNMKTCITRFFICAFLISALHSFGADTLISTSVWKYLDTGVDPGTVWREPAYDDTAWQSGLAQLGFGDGDEATVINSMPNGNPIITAYFRKNFAVTNPSIYTNLTLRLLRDDGGIVYINGVEVFRSNMSITGAVTYSTLATATADGISETTFVNRVIPASVLVPGVNLVAVEIHQVSPTSSDMSFDLQLIGNTPPPPPTNRPPVANPQNITVTQNQPRAITLTGSDPDGNPLTYSIVTGPSHGVLTGTPPSVIYIPATGYLGPDSFTFKVSDGILESAPATISINVTSPPPPPSQLFVATNAVWRYLDTGVDPGTAWRGLGYNDSAWLSGPAQLGFGDGDEATVINSMPNGSPIITAYFRRTFVVSNANQIASLAVRLWRDDGAIVYVNGVEVVRNNMPAGPVNYNTLASASAADDGNQQFLSTVPAGMLVSGLNVVAAEVHQNAIFSSDMTFMLELRGNPGASTNRPPVAVSQSVSVDEDQSVAITLQASDPDNNLLTYSYTQPAHGTVSGTAPNVVYQPAADFNGSDSFNFTVNDGRGGQATATISITVNPVNDPPVAVARAASASDPGNFVRNLVVVAVNNTDATVILDGSASSDIDGDTLQYFWFLNADPTPFSTAATVTVTLPIGNYSVTLGVSDGIANSVDTITVQIFTPCAVVENLAAQVQAATLEPNQKNALLGHLNAACATFGNGNISAGVQQLELFQVRVNNKIAPDDPALAQALNQAAQDIIDAVQ
jgi:hypothetical protein